MKRLTMGLALAAVLAGLQAPIALAEPPAPQPTPVVIQNLNDVNAVTADGAYLYLVQDAKGSRKVRAWIEDMNGKRWSVPLADSTAPLLGTETGGVFVFDHVAGSAPISFAFRPGTGILKGFINHRDPFALSMYDAILSSKGHWAAVRTNAPGSWGPGIYQWTDIDNTPVPMLTRAEALTWAPNGIELGYFSRESDNGQGWLGVYNVVTRSVQLLGVPFVLAERDSMTLQGWRATGFYSGAPSTAVVQWAPSGHWLAAQRQSPSSLQICSMAAGQGGTIPVPSVSDLWGWTGDDSIYIIDGATVSVYTNQGGNKWALEHRFVVPDNVVRAVSTPFGLLVETSSGELYRMVGRSMSAAVSVKVRAWWFDTQNGNLYVLPETSSGRVYSVKLT